MFNMLWIVLVLFIGGVIRITSDTNKIPLLRTPIDFNATFQGKPVFGKSKTWQGVIVFMGSAFIIEMIVRFLVNFVHFIALDRLPIGYSVLCVIFYSAGELINSFVKRRYNIPSGQSHYRASSARIALQYFFDQIDGFLPIGIYLYFIQFSIIDILLLLFIGLILHLCIDYYNHRYFSKQYGSIVGMNAFYQILIYFLLYPCKIIFSAKFHKSKIHISNKKVILVSNHVSYFDFLRILLSLNIKQFFMFAPFTYIISHKFRFIAPLVFLTGGIYNTRAGYFDISPLDGLEQKIQEGYNILWFWEGRINSSLTVLPAKYYKTGLLKVFCMASHYYVEYIKIDENNNAHVLNPTVQYPSTAYDVYNLYPTKELLFAFLNHIYFSS